MVHLSQNSLSCKLLTNANLTCTDIYWDAILNYVKLASELL